MSMIRQEGKQYHAIHTLIQLQELCVARRQQEEGMPGGRLKPLDDAIKAMKADLPPDITARFDRIAKRQALSIVPVSIASCSACGVKLPISMVNVIHAADTIESCPSCARMLYFPEGHPRGIPAKRAPGEVGVVRFSGPELMIPNLEGDSPEDVLGHLCRNLEEQGYIDDGAKLADEALRQEAMMSTAVEKAQAFPHVRGVEGGGLTLSIGIHRKGIKFGGSGRSLTRIFYFMVIPTAASVFYLKVMSGVSQAFRDDAAREALLATEDSESMWKALVKATRKTIT